MTVSTTGNKITYLGTGAATNFGFTFAMPPVPASAGALFLVVTVVNSSGISTVIAFGPGTSQYQLVLNAPVSPNPTGVGGTVTYNPLGVPIPLGSTITIERVLPIEQLVSLQNQGTLWQTVVEVALDFIVMELQQVSGLFSRAVVGPSSDPATTTYVLPTATARANQALVFDASGNVTTGVLPSSGVISAAMAPVVGAASLAAGRTAFGLGNIAVTNIGAGLQTDGTGGTRVDSPLTSDAINTAVTAAFHLNQRIVTAPLVYTLPRANTLWNGFGFWFFCVGGEVVLTPNVADSIDGAAAGALTTVTQGARVWITTDAAVAGNWRLMIDEPVSAFPQGRLTLIPGEPVMMTSVVNAATIYYTADVGNLVPTYTGSVVVWQAFTIDLQLILDAAGHIAGKVYDIFVTQLGGLLSLVTGPAWRNSGVPITNALNAVPITITAAGHAMNNGDTVYISGVQGNIAANGVWTVANVAGANFDLAGSTGSGAYTAATGLCSSRGNGAGTTQLARAGGVLSNAVVMTGRNNSTNFAGLAVGTCTYLGTFAADGGGNTTCNFFPGQSRKFYLWNAFNQRNLEQVVADPTASWLGGAPGIGISNGAAGNNVKVVIGLPSRADIQFIQKINCDGTNPTTAEANIGIGEGTVTKMVGLIGEAKANLGIAGTATFASNATARYTAVPAPGLLTYNALQNTVSGTVQSQYFGTEAGMHFVIQWRG